MGSAEPPPQVQKCRATANYSQVTLEPEVLEGAEKEQVTFEDRRESDQGMSIFATVVGLATPGDTAWVDVAVTIDPASTGVPYRDDAVQVVAFPFVVRGPFYVRGVDDGDDMDPIVIPNGRYDVLAQFFPKEAPPAEAEASLRVFDLELSFRPEGSLGAPKCFRLEDGATPPADLVTHLEIS